MSNITQIKLGNTSYDIYAKGLKGTSSSATADTVIGALNKVTQNPTSSDTTFDLILSYGATSATLVTNTVNKSTNLTYNPGTQSLKNGGCTLQYNSDENCLDFIFS